VSYDRYGMTVELARHLTREPALTVGDLEVAEVDLLDVVTTRPDPDGDVTDRTAGFGRAVAWQAAHRAGQPSAEADDRIARESFPDYTVDYRDDVAPRPVSRKVHALLVRWGWYTTSGYTTSGRAGGDLWSRL
jgi:hypothetical protein